MTLQDLESLSCLTITPSAAASVLRVDPDTIRRQARKDPALLGFPVVVLGSRTMIPRVPFIKFLKGEGYVMPGMQ